MGLSAEQLIAIEAEMIEAATAEHEPQAVRWHSGSFDQDREPEAERLFFGGTFEEKAKEERRRARVCREVAQEARAARVGGR